MPTTPILRRPLHNLWDAASIYVSPHRSEGFGLTVAEATDFLRRRPDSERRGEIARVRQAADRVAALQGDVAHNAEGAADPHIGGVTDSDATHTCVLTHREAEFEVVGF